MDKFMQRANNRLCDPASLGACLAFALLTIYGAAAWADNNQAYSGTISNDTSAGQMMPSQPMPDRPGMKTGIQAYNAGNYKKAIIHLGSALTTDFNNPVLHYYMANSHLHLHQTDAAIREFRIAYALDPENDVGRYSKEALFILGADESRPPRPPLDVIGRTAEKPMPPPPSAHDVMVGQSVSQLRHQAESMSEIQSKANEALLAEEQRRQQDYLSRAKTDLQNQYTYYSRRGGVHRMPIPADAQATLSSLKDLYDRQHANRAEMAHRQAEELKMSARNLEEQLHDQAHKGTHLVPEGTNLYIRNYRTEPKATDAKPSDHGTQSSSSGTLK